jgi:hypothetical protein
MREGGRTEPCSGHAPGSDRRVDRGSSLVEILVSVVLIGMVVTAVLVTLRTSVSASSTNRDHVNGHAWLQSASDVLYGSAREDCGTEALSREPQVRAAYEAIVRTTANPEGWPAEQISVVPPVLFWDGDSTYQTTCYDDSGVNLQLITIEVRGPNGRIVESVQVVKG